MYKFAFTYLVKQDKKSWDDFSLSLELLYKNVLRKLVCNYKIIVFCEGDPIKKVKKLIDDLTTEKNINIDLKKISLQSYVKRKKTDKYLKDFPSAANCKLSTSLGYRDMCKFFAIDVFFDESLNDVDYFIRLDTKLWKLPEPMWKFRLLVPRQSLEMSLWQFTLKTPDGLTLKANMSCDR